MTTRRRQRRTSSRLDLAFGSLVALVALPGCPMSDDYFVDPRAGGDGSGSGGSGGGGMSGSSGKAPKGGGAGSGGMPSAGTGGTGGSGGGWITTKAPPGGFSPREKAAYTSIGSQLFVWGGVNESGTALNSGALYDPRDDSWAMVASDANTPSPRSLATAVWTGSVIVVWGGLDPVSTEPLANGAIYDPVRDAWSTMSPGLTARSAPVGATVSERIVFFGGQGNAATPLGGLDHYDPDRDAWTPGMQDSPPPVADPAAAGGTVTFWTHGGRTELNTGVPDSSYYSMSTGWNESESLSPGRWGSFSAFIGAFFVWGGRDLNDLFNDGASHTPGAFSWDAMSSSDAPSPRFATNRESGWTFVMDAALSGSRLVLIGGLDAPGSYLTDGGIYDVDGDNWSAIPAWPSQASHAFGAAGVAAGELVVWGGRDGATLTNQGVRYRPTD